MTPSTTTTATLSTNEPLVPGKKRTDFFYSNEGEPHKTRRMAILKKHPEIKELFGYDPNSKYIVLFWWVTQFTLAYYLRNSSWPLLLLVAYVYGGVAGHALFLAMHEISHSLFFSSLFANQIFGIFTNLATVFPHYSMFKKYHLEHHRKQGDRYMDVDLPSAFEGVFFKNSLLKAIWMFFQPVFYITRPLLSKPKAPDTYDLICWTSCISFHAAMFHLFGLKFVVYLFISGFLGSGLHPVAGHFIAEHYVFQEGFETYSYYGPLNYVCFNVGYHNEHHDFPRIPGSRLPSVKKIAPEFYDHLPQHTSWVKVIWDYIMLDHMGPYSRVVRNSSVSRKKKD